MDEKTEKTYRWKETWRDHREFDWLCDMETCEEAIDSLRGHIENCDRLHDGRSIEEAERLILDIEDEIDARSEHPEWPTRDQMVKYCGKYLVSPKKVLFSSDTSDALIKKWGGLLDDNDNLSQWDKRCLAHLFENEQKELMSRKKKMGKETWNLTPDLLRTRWVSEDDFYRWRMDQYGVRVALIEPMPKQLIDEYCTLVMSKVTKDTGMAAERIDTATRSDNISIFFTRYK
jgi:hypothetical protein